MANYVEEIFNDNDESTDIIIKILDVIRDKVYEKEISSISNAEKTIFLVGEVEMEVNNGGFDQFFFNSGREFAKEAVNALKAIGAGQTAQLLEEAIAICNNLNPESEKEDEDDELTDVQQDMLNKLDEKFYEYVDDLTELQITYVKANISDFNDI